MPDKALCATQSRHNELRIVMVFRERPETCRAHVTHQLTGHQTRATQRDDSKQYDAQAISRGQYGILLEPSAVGSGNSTQAERLRGYSCITPRETTIFFSFHQNVDGPTQSRTQSDAFCGGKAAESSS
jgi:hypothetical protein